MQEQVFREAFELAKNVVDKKILFVADEFRANCTSVNYDNDKYNEYAIELADSINELQVMLDQIDCNLTRLDEE